MNFDFITELIAVGQKIDTPEFAEALRKAGITHVINLFGDHPDSSMFGFCAENLYLPQADDGTPRSATQIKAAIAYTFDAFQHSGKVYVHCQWGIGRAPAMAYAILRSFGLSQEEAVARINTRRPRAATGGWEQYIPSIEAALA